MAVNQIEYHMGYHRDDVLHEMQSRGTVLEAWASLGGPTVHGKHPTISLGDTRLKNIGAKYNVSTAQVVFRWENQKGVVPITATCNEEHARGDLPSFDFELSGDDLATLDALMPTNEIMI